VVGMPLPRLSRPRLPSIPQIGAVGPAAVDLRPPAVRMKAGPLPPGPRSGAAPSGHHTEWRCCYFRVALPTNRMGWHVVKIIEPSWIVTTPDYSGDASSVRPPWRRTDLVVIPLVLLIELFVFSTVVRDGTLSAVGRWGIIGYAAVGVLLLVIRYRAPIPVFAALWVHAMVAYLFIPGFYPVLTLLIALAAVAELCSIAVSLVALGSAMIPSALAIGNAVREASPAGAAAAAIATFFYSLLNGLAWGIGRWAGANRRHVRALHAEHRALAAEQQRQAEHAISEERLRIARELHDIVAHSVTIMVLHAAGAQRVLMSDPVRAGEALSTIEESGKQAMGELRRLLSVLRDSDAQPGPPALPLQGLAHLDVVVGSVRSSGVIVEVEVHGEPQPLDPSIDLAAFRLVQEGLTNVTKHVGAGARAVVSIDWGQDKVTIAVEDDGVGRAYRASALSTGNGLAGLAERITIAGGNYAAGPTDTGGFRVAARLPVSAIHVVPSRHETTRPEREPRRPGRPTPAHEGIPAQQHSAESEGPPSEIADSGIPSDDAGRTSGSVAGSEP